MEQELDLFEIWQIFVKRWKMIIAIPLLAALISGLVTIFVITPQYQASTMLIVLKNHEPTYISPGELQVGRQLVSTYGEIAKSPPVLNDVINNLDLPYGAGALRGKVGVSPVRNTEIINISVTDPDPILARNIANQLTASFMEKVVDIMKVENVSVINDASVPTAPVSPRPNLNIAVALVVGLMAAVGLAFLLEYLDKSIKTPEEVQKYLDLPVLGVIPQFEER